MLSCLLLRWFAYATEFAARDQPLQVVPRFLPDAPACRPAKAGAASQLEIDVVETAEEVVVRLWGDAGVPEAGVLEGRLSRLAARRPARVTLDLSELRTISTLAMGILVTYRRAATRAGARVYLAPSLRPAVHEALYRTELLGLFEADGLDRLLPGRPASAEKAPEDQRLAKVVEPALPEPATTPTAMV
jgi:anti-anti-sigma factor